mgnify:CR=1 FL=1
MFSRPPTVVLRRLFSGGKRRGKNARGKAAQKGKNSSSARWMQRQEKDPYVARAAIEGYRSRAAFKLVEINKKHKMLKRNMKILDLGCAPGSFLQVAQQQAGGSRIVGVDLLEMDPIKGVEFLQGDFEDEATCRELSCMLRGPVDLVMSDMAPSFCGIKDVDAARMRSLHFSVLSFLPQNLAVNGTFVTKIFRGQYDQEMIKAARGLFSKLHIEKPRSSRSESAEIYLVGLKYNGQEERSSVE